MGLGLRINSGRDKIPPKMTKVRKENTYFLRRGGEVETNQGTKKKEPAVQR